MNNCVDEMTKDNIEEIQCDDNKSSTSVNKIDEKDINEILACEDANESSLLNSIVEAVMRGDMNQVVTLALSHRNTDPKDKGLVDDALSNVLRNKLKCDHKEVETDIDSVCKMTAFDKEDVTAIEVNERSENKRDSTVDQIGSNCFYSTTMKSNENSDIHCSYYIDSNSIIDSSNNITYCQPGFHNRNMEHDNHSDDPLNGNYTHYQTTSSLHNIDSMNSTNSSQQSVQVQLPGIGNFLLQIPSNLKPGEPITLPISLPLTPVSQTSGGNPISINMSTGQLISNQLLSLYNPSSNMNNITIGKKMRAIAPKPSKPTYRQPLIAPKTNSPNTSGFTQESSVTANSTPLPAPSGPGRRKGTKGKKTGRKRGAPPKSRKDSSYASSTHSIDSQDATQFNESNNNLKQNCSNFINGRNTYQCNYFVNSDSSDYINHSHVPQSYNELHSNNLIDTSDSGEKDLLSLAWEISNAELGNNDDFTATYQLYDTTNLTSESFVSSEILDQFLQNIQKEDMTELSRCSSNQVNLDSRVSYASSFTTLPPCSTVLPSVTTSNYLNNSSNNVTNLELSQCIEIAEVVNLNTEDMLSELENEENALLDKFVAQYSSNVSDSLKCDTHIYTTLDSSLTNEEIKYADKDLKVANDKSKIDNSEKDIDPNITESNELSEIAQQIEKDCDESNLCNSSEPSNFLSRHDYDYPSHNTLNKSIESNLLDEHDSYNIPNSGKFCRIVTTPLELIYSTSTDAYTSTMVDVQNHYLMSVNMDNKRQTESTFYITDGSVQSKTLDDFGLFDFCTDIAGNHDSEAISLEEKKYLEPPILEDISDASPIPSDDESEDEDIDLCAFKFSKFTKLPFFLNNMYHSSQHTINELPYSFNNKHLPTLLDAAQLEHKSCSSDQWYIYDKLINNQDTFSIHEADKNKGINSDLMKSYSSEDKNIVKEKDISIEPRKYKKERKIESKTDFKVYDSGYNKERQSRLRKPPTKFAIYHSIKFIDQKPHETISEEQEVLKTLNSVQQVIKTLNTDKSNKTVNNCLKSKHIMKINHCTRSKGSISKSYDSFYETLEKTNRHQHSKVRKGSDPLLSKNRFDSKNTNNIETENSEIFPSLSTKIIDKNVIDSLILSDDNDLEVHAKFDNNTDTKLLKNDKISTKTFKSKKTLKISKMYNLRTNVTSDNYKTIGKRTFFKSSIDNKSIKKIIKNNLSLNESKSLNAVHSLKSKNKVKMKRNAYLIPDKTEIKNAKIIELIDQFDNLLNNDFIIIEQMKYVENCVCDLHKAVVDINYCCTNDIIESSISDNESHSNISKFENVSKTNYPVRKINRKLRLLSGLEHVQMIYYPTVIDMDDFDYLTEYRLSISYIEFVTVENTLISHCDCRWSIINSLEINYEYQDFEQNDEDFDDGDSCDARLVIVENDEVLNQNFDNICNIKNIKESIIEQCESLDNKKVEEPKSIDLPKRYCLRNKVRDTISVLNDISYPESASPTYSGSKRQSLKRQCKKLENVQHDNQENTSVDDCDVLNKISLKTPVCSIEKLTDHDIIANLGKDCLYKNNSDSINIDCYRIIENDNCDNISETFKCDKDNIKLNTNNYIKNGIISKLQKKMKKHKSPLSMYKNRLKLLWKTKKITSKSRLDDQIFKKQSNIKESLTLIENGMANINFETEKSHSNDIDNDNESIEVDEEVMEDKLCTFVDSNNVETFSRSYGTFSLKIKFQKQDPIITKLDKEQLKKQKRRSKKRRKLRNFLSSIMGSNDFDDNKSDSDDESFNEELDNKHHSRKRKLLNVHSSDSSNQENINQNDDIPPKLTPETVMTEDFEHQKPIKIKLFKATRDDFTKSEEVIFSLQKSSSDDRKENKSSIPKMLQVLKDQPSKPCRQAANLAKKKIFSTAKEDRRSQNATLTSIWHPRKANNILNKLPSDFIHSCNDRGRRPRGRPPKSNHVSLLTEKQTSSSGTLKLKIKLSKDFKNCNDDYMSSNGEISGRTSTNDSSILNSAVAGINGPSDALSLESNNFINGITQQLDENIEYLEAKDAKVYFDPHQVDIEKIKNSYYSSKKNSSIQFDNESQQNLYDDSIPELCNKKKDSLSTNPEFSQFNDNESSTAYTNLSKDYPSNNKISHMPKELINISESCYNSLSTNREPQDLSQSNQSYPFENHISSPGKNQTELWQSTKPNSSELIFPCRNVNNSWFSEHRSFPNSNSILYDSYLASNIKETKSCASQSQNSPFIMCENESSDSKHLQRSPSKRSSSKEGRKSSNNSFESHSQLSPNFPRGVVPPQLNINPWSDESNHNTSLNHTAAAWMTYAQQQAAAAAYMDPQMKAYYNLALSQSMLNNPYCGSYSNPVGNPEIFYSSLHSQYLNNSKDLNEKNSNASVAIRNHNNDPMGTFMEAAQMSSWEHFYSAAAMAGYHNTSQGAMDDYTGRAGNMLQAHHMLAGGYPSSVLTRDHFPIEGNKPPVAHQNQSGSTSPMKPISSPTPISSAQAYPHVQMPYSHFNGFF